MLATTLCVAVFFLDTFLLSVTCKFHPNAVLFPSAVTATPTESQLWGLHLERSVGAHSSSLR
jgi:hypothetical protein